MQPVSSRVVELLNDALTFELNGIILAANSGFVLREDPAILAMASSVVRRRLGAATCPSGLGRPVHGGEIGSTRVVKVRFSPGMVSTVIGPT